MKPERMRELKQIPMDFRVLARPYRSPVRSGGKRRALLQWAGIVWLVGVISAVVFLGLAALGYLVGVHLLRLPEIF